MIKGTATVHTISRASNLPTGMRSEDYVVCEVLVDLDEGLGEAQELSFLCKKRHDGSSPVSLGQKLVVTIERAEP